jgi:hypothetical protein
MTSNNLSFRRKNLAICKNLAETMLTQAPKTTQLISLTAMVIIPTTAENHQEQEVKAFQLLPKNHIILNVARFLRSSDVYTYDLLFITNSII